MSGREDSHQSPDIAIIGAGIAGITLAIACQKVGLTYTVYESGPEIWQHGSGIGLGPNAIKAMQLIDDRLPAVLDTINSQSGTQSADLHYRHGQDGPSWSAFDTVLKVPSEGAQTVARAAFMNQLVPFVPVERIKFVKHLDAITELISGKVQIDFRDGSSSTHDVVIGCDGIHSKTRTYILGKQNPDAAPHFTGKIVHRGVVQASDVHELLGTETEQCISVFLGHHGHITMLPIEGGKKYSVAGVASRKSWESEKWLVESSPQEIRDDYASWDDRLVRLLEKLGSTDVWALFDVPFPSTFVRGTVAVLGDAAHASTPFQGSGTSMAIEDAFILSNLLVQAPGSGKAKWRAALKAYDCVRRPRTQKQIRTALECGWIVEFEMPNFGSDIEAIKKSISTRLHWIWHVDLPAELERGLDLMRQ